MSVCTITNCTTNAHPYPMFQGLCVRHFDEGVHPDAPVCTIRACESAASRMPFHQGMCERHFEGSYVYNRKPRCSQWAWGCEEDAVLDGDCEDHIPVPEREDPRPPRCSDPSCEQDAVLEGDCEEHFWREDPPEDPPRRAENRSLGIPLVTN